MVTRLTLFAWLVGLEALDAAAERQAALDSGQSLVGLAVRDRLVGADAGQRSDMARALAELQADKWITWDWTPYGSDPRPEQPAAAIFDNEAIQRVRNIRITPEGYAAYAARQALSGEGGTRQSDGDTEQIADGSSARYDLFISHASEDKEAVARPLAVALQSRGFSVWFDEERLEVGASLRKSIDAGLAGSRYGLVVLSRAFFDKPWPQRELDGLFALEIASGDELILPLWHDIDEKFLVSHAPMIADRFALRTATGTEDNADRLARRLRRKRGQDQLRDLAVAPPPPPIAAAARNVPPTETGARITGVETRERVIQMLRADDPIGLRELLRFERRAFEQGVLSTLSGAADELGSSAEPELLAPVEKELWAQVDRRLGSLLPVMEYRADAIEDELGALVSLAGTVPPTRSPYAAWLDGPRWPVWLVTLILGSAAVAVDRFDVVTAIWDQRASWDDGRPLPAAHLGGGADLGGALLRARGASVSHAIELWYPAFASRDSELLTTHYPEVMRGSGPDTVLGFLSRAGDFLWLCGALAGRDKVPVIPFWAASQVHPTLRARLTHDATLSQRLAAAIGIPNDELASTLDRWIGAVQGPSI
jgi:hypothetical protein